MPKTNVNELQLDDNNLYDSSGHKVPVSAWKFWKTPAEGIDVPVPSTDNEYGPEVVIKEGSVLVPLGLSFGYQTDASEMVTFRIRVYYSDGSYAEDTFSGNYYGAFIWGGNAMWGGNDWEHPTPLQVGGLNWVAKDGVYITKITASVKTNKANSTAIAKVAGIGLGA